MEVVAYDSETVTIKMHRKKEFLRLVDFRSELTRDFHRKLTHLIVA